jgi:predicted GIY-YIG superfamily endonuclease
MIAGIYYILNERNYRIYIGASENVDQRITDHRNRLRRGTHINKALQSDWNDYGESAFTTALLVEHKMSFPTLPIALAWLYDMERFWIRFYRATQPEYGYNCDHRKKSLVNQARRRAARQ